jgi:hypothetical protein
VPNGNDPNVLILDSIEKAIRVDDDFTIGEVGKFGDDPTGLRECSESAQDFFGPLPKMQGSGWVSFVHVGNDLEELGTARWSEADSHLFTGE